jgi:hypothetical protein
MSALSIYAGPTALEIIRRDGLNANQISTLVGASGGPKWFVLYGLDRYLFGEFFAGRDNPLVTLGSSAGAWRVCCLALADPVAAVERLATIYSLEQYSAKPTTAEITKKARAMLAEVLGAEGIKEIINNEVFRTHIVTDRCKGFGSSTSRVLQFIALATSALANAISRKTLSLFYQRIIFTNMGQLSPWAEVSDLDTKLISLTEENVFDVMIASGSIPFILDGVRDIAGAPRGQYWDGGITDYHFDFLFHRGSDLVLYPHFSPKVIPGWFDKHLPWRSVNAANFHNVVLVVPSQSFVDSLPYGKIPDRKDFNMLGYEARLAYWQVVLNRSAELADDFKELIDNGVGLEAIQPFYQSTK